MAERHIYCCIVGTNGFCDNPGKAGAASCGGCLKMVREKEGGEEAFWIWVERYKGEIAQTPSNVRPMPFFKLSDLSDQFLGSTAWTKGYEEGRQKGFAEGVAFMGGYGPIKGKGEGEETGKGKGEAPY